MDRHTAAAVAAPAPKNPKTEASTFTITALDVGTYACRPGAMAELEQDRAQLLTASKLVLERLRQCNIMIGAHFEYALEAAIKLAEAPR